MIAHCAGDRVGVARFVCDPYAIFNDAVGTAAGRDWHPPASGPFDAAAGNPRRGRGGAGNGAQVNYGVVLVADAPVYLSVADSLRAGTGFAAFSDWNYSLWPPLYPMLLAAASLYVFDPHDVAGPLNAGILGLTVFAVGHCLRRYLRHRFLAVVAALSVTLSIPLTTIAAAALTEPLFILLASLALAQTARFLDNGKIWALELAAAQTGLALLRATPAASWR